MVEENKNLKFCVGHGHGKQKSTHSHFSNFNLLNKVYSTVFLSETAKINKCRKAKLTVYNNFTTSLPKISDQASCKGS